MRRAAIQSFRAVRRLSRQKGFGGRGGLPADWLRPALNLRNVSTSRREHALRPTSLSSMRFRNVSVALASAFVASGAWYAYRGAPLTSSPGDVRRERRPFDSGGQANPFQASAASRYADPSVKAFNETDEAGEASGLTIVIDHDQFYTSAVAGEGPLQKTTDDAGRKMLGIMTPEQATQKLRRNEESYLVGRGRGVVRYDVVQIPSNDPIEDDHSEKIVEVNNPVTANEDGLAGNDWMFWGVYDGHSGWTTSAKLRQVLISFVARELNATYKSALADPALTVPTPESIDAAIKKAFLQLDHEIIYESVEKVIRSNSKRVGAELLAPALSGSCALLSFYDSRSKLLRVACTGDSRAVLGRRTQHGDWTATALSVDQTGSNDDEVARLRREHPGESDVVRNGRVLGGLEPTRAFGDSFYKWSRDTQKKIKGSFFGRTPSQLLRTPPYVTAEPVVTTIKVDPTQGDFVVMATDGLWEMLTNEEVVGLVGQWLEAQGDIARQSPSASSSPPSSSSSSSSSTSGARTKSWLDSWFKQQSKSTALPVTKEGPDVNGKQPTNGQRTPIRQQQWGLTANQDSRFVVEDRNAATHLVRNALGGRDGDMVCALLTLPSPYSRRYRDDLTVEVIFFGEGDRTGNVILNPDASAQSAQFKARL